MGERLDVLRVFDEHHALLFRFAYRLTGSAADAEDIVQTCFVELIKPGCSYDPKRAPIRAWLIGVARNQSRKRLQQKPTPDLPDAVETSSPEYQTLRSELEDVVRRAVLALPESKREVLILAHYEQLALSEIAGILGIDLGAVKSRLQRALLSPLIGNRGVCVIQEGMMSSSRSFFLFGSFSFFVNACGNVEKSMGRLGSGYE